MFKNKADRYAAVYAAILTVAVAYLIGWFGTHRIIDTRDCTSVKIPDAGEVITCLEDVE